MLHAIIVGAGGPCVVDRVCGADQAELDVCRRVRSVELGKLSQKRVFRKCDMPNAVRSVGSKSQVQRITMACGRGFGLIDRSSFNIPAS